MSNRCFGGFCGYSRLGFGCASLGSRVSARSGLNALEAAFDKGINWFDLAPSYGDGECESIFSQFVPRKREKIFICTKVGISAGRVSTVARIVRPTARFIVGALPSFRKFAALGRVSAKPTPISGQEIDTSIDASLTRLRTDYVDVLALHDPQPADLRRDDVLRALERTVCSGKARKIGIAGTFDAGIDARQISLPVDFIQFETSQVAEGNIRRIQADPRLMDCFIATHSVYSVGIPSEVTEMATRSPSVFRNLLSRHGYGNDIEDGIRSALLDYAFAANSEGVVIVSMFQRSHCLANLNTLSRHGERDAAAFFAEVLAAQRRKDAVKDRLFHGNSEK